MIRTQERFSRCRLLVACAAGLAVLACVPPDVPPGVMESLPEEALDLLKPVRVDAVALGEGLEYRRVRSSSGPWDVHLVRADLDLCDLGVRVVAPRARESDDGRRTVTRLVRESEHGIVAAINGDFFTEEGRPAGVEATAGSLSSGGSGPVFAWRPGEAPRIGPVEWQGDTLTLGAWQLVSGTPDGRTEIIGGFPVLLQNGGRVGDLELADRPQFSGQRHPRTAVGFDPERNHLWFVVVDGRREGVSSGMTLEELAELMTALGNRDALNLDGGGSSVMVLRHRVVNRPAAPGGEREVANALAVHRDSQLCPDDEQLSEEEL